MNLQVKIPFGNLSGYTKMTQYSPGQIVIMVPSSLRSMCCSHIHKFSHTQQELSVSSSVSLLARRNSSARECTTSTSCTISSRRFAQIRERFASLRLMSYQIHDPQALRCVSVCQPQRLRFSFLHRVSSRALKSPLSAATERISAQHNVITFNAE